MRICADAVGTVGCPERAKRPVRGPGAAAIVRRQRRTLDEIFAFDFTPELALLLFNIVLLMGFGWIVLRALWSLYAAEAQTPPAAQVSEGRAVAKPPDRAGSPSGVDVAGHGDQLLSTD